MTKALLAVALLVGSASAQDKTPPGPPQMTAEQRAKMAETHEKMAACLRSDRPVGECHEEMKKGCHDTMGHECPMMGGHGGHGPTKGKGKAKGAPAGKGP